MPTAALCTGEPETDRLADRASSILIIVDLQDSYRDKLHEELRTLEATARLCEAARILEVPVVLTEQYPERLGTTMSEIERSLPESAVRFAKRTFSCLGADGLVSHLEEQGRRQVILAGIEAHVCVNQTAHDLLCGGYQVHAVRDAITSRFALEAAQGFDKMVGSGVIPSSVECVLFEWLRDSRSPDFKAVQRLVL